MSLPTWGRGPHTERGAAQPRCLPFSVWGRKGVYGAQLTPGRAPNEAAQGGVANPPRGAAGALRQGQGAGRRLLDLWGSPEPTRKPRRAAHSSSAERFQGEPASGLMDPPAHPQLGVQTKASTFVARKEEKRIGSYAAGILPLVLPSSPQRLGRMCPPRPVPSGPPTGHSERVTGASSGAGSSLPLAQSSVVGSDVQAAAFKFPGLPTAS